LERHFLRKLLADLVNHLSSAIHLQAVLQFQIYELPLLGPAVIHSWIQPTTKRSQKIKSTVTIYIALGFLPGAAGGIYPANRQRIPSIFLPFSNLIEWHDIISPLAASSDKWRRTLASETPIDTAISWSSRSPYFFRYSKISFMV
jgi:hypothetical protein